MARSLVRRVPLPPRPLALRRRRGNLQAHAAAGSGTAVHRVRQNFIFGALRGSVRVLLPFVAGAGALLRRALS